MSSAFLSLPGDASAVSPSPSANVQALVEASERANTRVSYAAAIRHFEQQWHGLLPATEGAVAQYLADHAASHSVATLRQRLAALSRWHSDFGFPDPTKSPLVRKVLRGIRATQVQVPRQAKALGMATLEQLDAWLLNALVQARSQGDLGSARRHARDRSLLLLGFWRGFRSDELTRLQIEHITLTPGEGLSCYLPRSKADRHNLGQRFDCPALSRLCPVEALQAWLELSGLRSGPLYRGIDQWGHIAPEGMAAASIGPLLQRLLRQAGVAEIEGFSSHSLRRGFATWARDAGWDVKELMAYVGWKDMKSAMRYLDLSQRNLQSRFEQSLAAEGQIRR